MKLKLLLLAFIFIATSTAYPRSSGSSSEGKYKYFIEGFYGFSSVNPSDLNEARQNFIWNSTRASSGNFSKFNYFGGTIGKRIGSHFLLSIRYEHQTEVLGTTDVGGGVTVADYFLYNPILLLLEIPFQGKNWSFSFGGGVGYAFHYEFHQQFSGTQEDITYQAHPLVFRGRVTLGYALSKNFWIFAEGQYDKVSAPSLAADKDYQATVNGSALTSGTTFKDAAGSSAAKADMSGIRYGVGLRVVF